MTIAQFDGSDEVNEPYLFCLKLAQIYMVIRLLEDLEESCPIELTREESEYLWEAWLNIHYFSSSLSKRLEKEEKVAFEIRKEREQDLKSGELESLLLN